jgi:dTDP-4-amino-4,6-dideoxygalactose transaminase
MNIQFADLRPQTLAQRKQIVNRIMRVIDRGIYIAGAEVERFENEFAQYLNVQHVATLNSGTDALIIGLRALEIPPDSDILIPTNTFFSAAYAVVMNSCRPVFVDVDPADNGIDVSDMKRKITTKTKAVIVTHLYGQADKLDEIQEAIKGKDIYLIEDSAQAHGARYNNQRVGSFGILSTFSFYPTKNLGAFGDGGAISTNEKILAEKIALLKMAKPKNIAMPR